MVQSFVRLIRWNKLLNKLYVFLFQQQYKFIYQTILQKYYLMTTLYDFDEIKEILRKNQNESTIENQYKVFNF